MPERVGDHIHYSGAVHMHTTESDGTRPFDDVVAFGREAGCDFLMLSDHMTLAHRENGREGWYGDTLVVVGYEHNDAEDNHHYLLFESPKVYPNEMSARQYVAAGAADGAIGILAHPYEVREAMASYRPYPWLDWDVRGYTGIELWNQMSEWMEQLTRWNLVSMAFSPRKSLVAPPAPLLRKFDEINLRRKAVGIISVDAHAFKHRIGPLAVTIFPYKVHFRCLRTCLIMSEPLDGDPAIARTQVYQALRDCRVFGYNQRWGDAISFAFTATDGSATVASGGELPSCDNARLRVTLPHRATLKLIRDGHSVITAETDELDHRVTAPGIYRVEAWKGRRGWIFSNHIRIGKPPIEN